MDSRRVEETCVIAGWLAAFALQGCRGGGQHRGAAQGGGNRHTVGCMAVRPFRPFRQGVAGTAVTAVTLRPA